MFRYFVILGLIIPFLYSCEKIQTYPDTPQIEFISYTLRDSVLSLDTYGKVGLLKFYFIDGDGNVGHSDNDNDTTDLFLSLYNEIDGKFVREILDTNLYPPETHHIPYMETLGQNKTLQGEIEVKITYYTIPANPIKYYFYIIDRDNNKSNVDSTDVIIFD